MNHEHSIERFKRHSYKVHKVIRLYLIRIQLFILNVIVTWAWDHIEPV